MNIKRPKSHWPDLIITVFIIGTIVTVARNEYQQTQQKEPTCEEQRIHPD